MQWNFNFQCTDIQLIHIRGFVVMNTFTNQTNLLIVRQQRLSNFVVIVAMFHTFIPFTRLKISLTNSHAIYRHTSRI